MKKLLFIILCFFSFLGSSFAYNKAVVDITTMDIYEIQDAVDKGYLTYELLTKLYLDRINAYDKDFNTIITLNANVIEEAKELDEIYKKEGRNSILFGIPILVKDNIDVKGMPTTAGAKSLSDNYPKDDAEIIKKLKEKNVLIIGKTNMSEFAFEAYSSESSYGITKNAYNTYFSSYGSSGGSAVGVSLQFGLLGIGTDTNASIRLPSSANNVIGFRPTLGNLSNDGIINYDITRDTAGTITKNVLENAILMAVLEGKDERFYTKNIEDSKSIRVGVIDLFLEDSYTEIENLMKNTMTILEENDIEVVHIDNFSKNKLTNTNNNTLAGWTMCYAFNNYIKNSSSKIADFYKLAMDKDHIYSLLTYITDCNKDIDKIDEYDSIKDKYQTYIEKIYQKYNVDFLIFPSSNNRVLKLEEKGTNLQVKGSLIASILGYPSVAISIGKDADNLYYGMEVLGLKNSEQKLYQFIYKLQTINDNYILSELAPPLYEVSNEVSELVNLYENNIKKDLIINFYNNKYFNKYKDINEEVKEFIDKYNDLTDKEIKEASDLLNEYKIVTEKVNSSINISLSTLIIPVILIILFVIYIKRKRNN